MKKIGVVRLVLIGFIVLGMTLADLPNATKASVYQIFNRIFSEKSTQINVALNVLSIQKTPHTYDKDAVYLVEYAPNRYVFMQVADNHIALQKVLTGEENQLSVTVISLYEKQDKKIKKQFSFTDEDIADIPEEKRVNLLRTRFVSLTQFHGLTPYWLITIGFIGLVINVMVTLWQWWKRRNA